MLAVVGARELNQDVRDGVGELLIEVAVAARAIGRGVSEDTVAIAHLLDHLVGLIVVFELLLFLFVKLGFVEFFDVLDVVAGEEFGEFLLITGLVVIGVLLGLVLDGLDRLLGEVLQVGQELFPLPDS